MTSNNIPCLVKLYIRLVGILLVCSGLYFSIGGWLLISYQGSWYYLPMGIALIIAGIYIIMLRIIGLIIYSLAYIASVLWSLWEVGFDYWLLIPRLWVLTGFTAFVAFTYPAILRYRTSNKLHLGGYVLGVLLLASLGLMFNESGPIHSGYYAKSKPLLKQLTDADRLIDWQQPANSTGGRRFTAAGQITQNNINKLQQAWLLHIGNLSEGEPVAQNTPLFVDDVLYICTPLYKIIAIDPDKGKQLWQYDPQRPIQHQHHCRGLAYYQGAVTVSADAMLTSAEAKNEQSVLEEKEIATLGITSSEQKNVAEEICTNRIFMDLSYDKLVAVDSKTGRLCIDFGHQGIIDLANKIDDSSVDSYGTTAPPIVAGEVVVVGATDVDNYTIGKPSGIVRAFDVHNGQLIWTWDPTNSELTPISSQIKTHNKANTNSWATMSYDAKLDLLYAATGNVNPHYVVSKSSPYNASITAIEAKTGKIRWQFSMAQQSLGDYDVPFQPLLYDMIDDKGKTKLALLQVTQSGDILMLDRVTGKTINEKTVKSVIGNNIISEPYFKIPSVSGSVRSIDKQNLKETDMWGITPFDQLWCRVEFASMNQNLSSLMSIKKPLQRLDSLGITNWEGISVDPMTDYMFVSDTRIAQVNGITPKAISSNKAIQQIHPVKSSTPFAAMQLPFISPIGIPCQAPPYETMQAIDLKTGKAVWNVPVDTLKDKGMLDFIAMKLAIPIGMPTLSGSMATKTGLLFFAGNHDFYLRAYNSYTGQELWKGSLPGRSQSAPISFISPKTGNQYVVLTVSDAHSSLNKSDYVIAWRLAD